MHMVKVSVFKKKKNSLLTMTLSAAAALLRHRPTFAIFFFSVSWLDVCGAVRGASVFCTLYRYHRQRYLFLYYPFHLFVMFNITIKLILNFKY